MNENLSEKEKTQAGFIDPVEKNYLRLLPLDKEKVDIFLVFNREYPLVAKWIDLFFSPNGWETDIHADFLQTELFRNFYFESKNIQKTKGEHQFAFGFPLVLETNERYISKSDAAYAMAIDIDSSKTTVPEPVSTVLTPDEKPALQTPVARNLTKTYTVYASDDSVSSKEKNGDSKKHALGAPGDTTAGSDALDAIFTAPLFIWYLHIKPHPTRKDSWIIGRDEAHPVVANDYLIRFYQSKYGADGKDLKDKLYQFALQKIFYRKDIDVLCNDLGRQLGYSNGLLNSGLRECPSPGVLRGLKAPGDISWSGVLGLFPHQRAQSVLTPAIAFAGQYLTTGLEPILSALSKQVKPAEPGHEFSLLPEDAFQKTAIRTSLGNKLSLIEGGHGTGKTHTSINLTLNALSNGQKTVVVANDLSTLMQVQNALVDVGVGNLTILLKDLLFDQKLIQDGLRNEGKAKNQSFKEEEFKITLKQGRRLLIKSDARHKALNEGIFGGEPFSEVVGHYLQSRESGGKEILSAHLNTKDYEFNKEEFTDLREATIQSKNLYRKVNTLKHPLGVLHPNIFIGNNQAAGKRLATEQTEYFLEKFRILQRKYMETLDAYAQKTLSHYERGHAALSDQLNNLKEDFSDFSFQYGADFEQNNLFKTGALTIASVFSQRSKQTLQAKSEVLQEYADLQKLFNEQKYFTHQFLTPAERKDFKRMQLNLHTFELALDAWRKKTPSLMQEEMGRLNGKTSVFFDPDASQDINDLETATDLLEQELNDARLYEIDVLHKTLTLVKRQLFVEEIIEQLEDTRNQIRDFDNYYDWRRYWLQLSAGAQKLIQSLIKVKPDHWTSAFESWYFYNMLLKYYQSDAVHSDEPLDQLNEMEDKLRKLMPDQITALWQNRKEEIIQTIKRNDPAAYRSFYAPVKQKQSKGNYLKDIIRDNLLYFTENYPVLLTTPQVYCQLLESNSAVVDLTIFENSVQADLPLLRLVAETAGRIVVIDENGGEEPDENTLAGLAKKTGASSTRLYYLHRNVSESVHKINDSVFYPGLQTPFHRKAAFGQFVQVVQCEGKWNASTRTNEAEIKALVRTLEEIAATPFNTYPHIGVVCMNKDQRNAFNATLLNMVQKTIFGWEKIAHLQRNGLGVYSVEEIDGLQFELLIVGGSYDQIDAFPANKKRLRALLNSFTNKLIWINSIPKNRLAEARNDPNHEAPYLLASLLLLGDHISEERLGAAQLILEELEQRYVIKKDLKPSVFAAQVRSALSRWIAPAQVKEHFLINGYIFPIIVLDKEAGGPIVIRVDGRFQPATYFNADWDRKTLAELERLQFPVVSIWSYNWWKFPEKEAENLAYHIMTLQEKTIGNNGAS